MLSSIVNDHPLILVRQVKEWGEILVGWEARNRYVLQDERGETLALASEEGGGIGRALLRNFLGRCRAAKIHVLHPGDHHEMALGQKPFRFFFHRMEVTRDGVPVGTIQRKFSILNRVFEVEDAAGRVVLTVKSPLFRIWTFKILDGQDRQLGVIRKKWGGLLREAFTDADTFGIELQSPEIPEDIRIVLLLGTFLIDFTCFENNSNSGGILSSLGD